MAGADILRLTILGCGSSPGTPRITGDWGACDPSNPRNRRSRASALVERITANGRTTVVIDTGPDFREQMIRTGVRRLDAICPGFASDCLETLEEMAMQYGDRFRAAGGEALRYIPALNADDAHVEAITTLARRQLDGWMPDAIDPELIARRAAVL